MFRHTIYMQIKTPNKKTKVFVKVKSTPLATRVETIS